MMTAKPISGAGCQTYFEHDSDYYKNNNQVNYDRWHGGLADTLGVGQEVSQEQFKEMLAMMQKQGKKRMGIDCAFSAPKSVSLAMAMDEKTKNDMIEAHQAAVEKMAEKIELEYIGCKVNHGQAPLTHNMIGAEFLHTMARPTKDNDFIPDLDVHSHLYIKNLTFYNGKFHAIDFKKIMDGQKRLGLEYRAELAKELQARGYELTMTDERHGFFELSGFDRETIEQYSHREKEVLAYRSANPGATIGEAVARSKSAKDKATKTFAEVAAEVKRDIFDSKKATIKKKGDRNHENDRHTQTLRLGPKNPERAKDYSGSNRQRPGAGNPLRGSGYPGDTGNVDGRGPGIEPFADRPSLSQLPLFGMDPENQRGDMLLPESERYRLAERQATRVRNTYLRRAAESRRSREIDDIAAKAIKTLAAEKYAFSAIEARDRIMAAGVLTAITQDEAEQAIERANVVKLGRREDNKNDKNIYLTTETNLQKEADIAQRVTDGKGKVTAAAMTSLEARQALREAEEKAIAKGETDFRTEIGEQGDAVAHILSCQDRYVAVDGLAGTGKTTMCERLKWVCDEKGITVKGCCYTGKAADGLQADSGIESTTIHGFLNRLERESGVQAPQQAASAKEIRQEWDFSRVQRLPHDQREIWAVDEAGLVDNNLMSQLQAAAEARGAQVLLLGDPDQLPPVGGGTPMKAMEEAGMATAMLTDIRRQKDMELREAVKQSVNGDHLKTFDALDKKGDYREIKDQSERREAVKAEMTAESLDSYNTRLLLTARNADRKAYNRLIRAEYVSRGEIDKGQKCTVTNADGNHETRYFAAKDRIIFCQNDKRMGVMNGTMATISAITGDNITAKTDAGKVVSFDLKEYDKIDYSYAVTEYKSQGMTVKTVVADMGTKGGANSRNQLYVDISRAKQRAIVYTDNKDKLESQTREFAHKITGRDFARKIRQMRLQQGITGNDRYHAPRHDYQEEAEQAIEGLKRSILPESILPPTPAQQQQMMDDDLDKKIEKYTQYIAAAQAAQAATQARRGHGPQGKSQDYARVREIEWSRDDDSGIGGIGD